LPSLITFQFHSLVVSLSDMREQCFHAVNVRHLALKGLKKYLEATFFDISPQHIDSLFF